MFKRKSVSGVHGGMALSCRACEGPDRAVDFWVQYGEDAVKDQGMGGGGGAADIFDLFGMGGMGGRSRSARERRSEDVVHR